MSRAYRIRVAASERRHIHVEDAVCTDIELLPILPRERLGALLTGELVRRGFVVDGGTARRRDADGIVIEVDIASGRVSARLEHAQEVEANAAADIASTGPELDENVRQRAKEQLESEVEHKLEAEKARLQRQVTERLEKKLRDLQKELDEVSTRVAGDALKEKAAAMGEITELSEDESGGLTIKVRL